MSDFVCGGMMGNNISGVYKMLIKNKWFVCLENGLKCLNLNNGMGSFDIPTNPHPSSKFYILIKYGLFKKIKAARC